MHQTTIRFASDTWRDIERYARLNGVSAAQYVREAAVVRLAIDGERSLPSGQGGSDLDRYGSAAAGRASARGARESSEAVWAQAQLARKRAREMREAARALQASRRVAE